jgi:hypothetical protein
MPRQAAQRESLLDITPLFEVDRFNLLVPILSGGGPAVCEQTESVTPT